MATTSEQDEQFRLALEGPGTCYTDDLEALMKSLEESLPSCCGSTEGELAGDILSAIRVRDKADSVSSEISSASGGEGSPSSSCAEQEEVAKGNDEEDDTKLDGEDMLKDNPHSATPDSNTTTPDSNTTPSSSRHSMVMRRRTEREYNLRSSSIINRIQTEQRRMQPRKPKPKAAPPPLSKYRRRTANSRERSRMAEINDAFEVLRRTIPSYPTEPSGVKLTKITTLRMALNYISAMREMLGYTNAAIPNGPSTHPGTESLGSAGSSGSGSDTGSMSPTLSRAPRVSPGPSESLSIGGPAGSDMTMDMGHFTHDPCFGLLDSEDDSVIS